MVLGNATQVKTVHLKLPKQVIHQRVTLLVDDKIHAR